MGLADVFEGTLSEDAERALSQGLGNSGMAQSASKFCLSQPGLLHDIGLFIADNVARPIQDGGAGGLP